MRRREVLAAGLALPVGMGATSTGAAAAARARAANPLVLQRADPHILRQGGWYYFTGSVPEYDRVVLRRARTIAGLATAPEVVIWQRPASGRMAGYIWAPELHFFDGRWHIYFAAGDGDQKFRIRTYVLASSDSNPTNAKWSLLGQLETPWDTFTLDCTSFAHRGRRYLCWAQTEPGIATNSNLYLAPIDTPTTLAAQPVRLTVPTLEWEVQGYKVAEGPAVLARNGRLFLTYSGSATDARYCMGMLTARADADIMDAGNWAKSPVPVFASSDRNSVYGPGHNSFVVDERARDLLVYHGRDYREIAGNPLFDPNRHARVQPIRYRPDGTPDFGEPVANGPLI
ncbi:family 43 glycosylhydrolase [Sphingomonas sp. FW199]|uniref:glycoside hydrolase family 43 protein n=1 Tax=Sphingomonas sp. FW199 TaxID=3400217 RepID=UPI003CE7B0A9